MIGNYTYSGYKKDGSNVINKLELISAIISSTLWRAYNGDTILHVNEDVLEYLEEHRIVEHFSTIKTDSLAKIKDYPIDERKFWAASKLFCYRDRPIGEAFIDLDYIRWTPLNDYSKYDLVCSHLDKPKIVATAERMNPPKGFPSDKYFWSNFTNCNASFVIFNNEKLKAQYCSHAIRFMCNHKSSDSDGHNTFAYMCMAEQVLMYEIFHNSKIHYVADEGDQTYYHLWGVKYKGRKNKALGMTLANKLKAAAKLKAPQLLPTIEKIIDNKDIPL